MSNLDQNIGRLLHHLKKFEPEQHTILIFMTNNGPPAEAVQCRAARAQGNGARGRHPRAVLSALASRAVKAGTNVDRLTAHIDIEPTLLNACGVPRPSNVKMNGVSLYPLLRNRAMDWKDRAIYFQWHGCERAELYRSCAARSQHYRLVNGKELYDLQEDPGEQRDVPSAHPDVVAKMLVGHQAWSRDVSSTELRAAANLHRHEDREPGHADSPGLGLG